MKTKNYEIRWHYTGMEHNLFLCGTYCIINNENTFFYGKAICSDNDHFSRDKGRKLSLARALKNSNISKEERKEIWEAYRNLTKKPRW
jgi:hypothetical protein